MTEQSPPGKREAMQEPYIEATDNPIHLGEALLQATKGELKLVVSLFNLRGCRVLGTLAFGLRLTHPTPSNANWFLENRPCPNAHPPSCIKSFGTYESEQRYEQCEQQITDFEEAANRAASCFRIRQIEVDKARERTLLEWQCRSSMSGRAERVEECDSILRTSH